MSSTASPRDSAQNAEVFETTFYVRFAETDLMGIVHHSQYVVWMEEGRSDLMRRQGFTFDQWERGRHRVCGERVESALSRSGALRRAGDGADADRVAAEPADRVCVRDRQCGFAAGAGDGHGEADRGGSAEPGADDSGEVQRLMGGNSQGGMPNLCNFVRPQFNAEESTQSWQLPFYARHGQVTNVNIYAHAQVFADNRSPERDRLKATRRSILRSSHDIHDCSHRVC